MISSLSGGRGGACRPCDGAVQSTVENQKDASAARETRGLIWVVGAFLICPCHLPLTLGLAITLLGGTTAGVALRGHPYVAGTIITVVWSAATWHGFRLMRSVERAGRST